MKKKTIIRLSVTLIAIVALGLWINSRWSAWFHNEEELPYAPQSEPGRVLLTFGDENELSRNISWQRLSQNKFEMASIVSFQIEVICIFFKKRSLQACF